MTPEARLQHIFCNEVPFHCLLLIKIMTHFLNFNEIRLGLRVKTSFPYVCVWENIQKKSYFKRNKYIAYHK